MDARSGPFRAGRGRLGGRSTGLWPEPADETASCRAWGGIRATRLSHIEPPASGAIQGHPWFTRAWLSTSVGAMSTTEETVPASPTTVAVEAHDLARRYGEGATAVDALRGVDIAVRTGELVAVMGPSGSGKSTLMHILAGLDSPTSGTVTVAGTDITHLGDSKLTHLRREHIGFVFQFFNLLPMLDAEENVVLPLSIAGEKPDKAWLDELLGKMGLDNRRSHRPAELSGGQQQRVAIARALVSRPTILFADEPTGNLDSKTGGEILELMRDSVDAYGQTTVMVTHEARAASIADRILFLADGLIVKELHDATAADVLAVMSELHS